MPSSRTELDIETARTWTDSLAYWGDLLCHDGPIVVSEVDDAQLYLDGVERALAILEETFARLAGDR